MPGRVHAIVVVRPDGRTSAAYHLRRTFTALAAQTRRVDTVTVVACGDDPALTDALEPGSLPDPTLTQQGIDRIMLPGRARFAAAVAEAAAASDADALWLLAQDTVPEPQALERLAGQLELSGSLSLVAPKLVRHDEPERIVSLGVSVTRAGESVELAAGDLDQGQHDQRTDVLGVDVRGALVRTAAFRMVRGIDPALRGADEGLDLSVALRLAGSRVALVPTVRVGVSGDGVAGLPDATTGAQRRANLRRRRTARLHRLLAYTHPLAVVPLWFALPLLAVVRSLAQLVTKVPGRVLGEWVATIVAMVRVAAVARARRRLRRHRTASWSRFAALRVSNAVARERAAEPDAPPLDAVPRGDLRFFAGGGAWLVMAMCVLSAAAFPALLAWPALGGGALQPLRESLAVLWADATWGVRPLGWNEIGPADPFAAVVAVVGSLWPFSPSRAIVLLWLAALPLAALGGWFAATRVTDRPILRILVGVGWAFAPMLLVALIEGVPTGVIAHLLLPWLFFAAATAARAWVPAAAASMLAAAVIATAPSLAPALGVLLVGALVVSAARRAGGAVSRMLWMPVPTLVLCAPVVWAQVQAGNLWGMLADPGPALGAPAVAGTAGERLLVAGGFPLGEDAGWSGLFPESETWWVALLLVPVVALAVAAVTTPRWPVGVVQLGLVVLGMGTAVAAVHIGVRFADASVYAVWPGAGGSLAWWGALGGAALTLDQWARAAQRRRSFSRGVPVVSAFAVVSMAALVVLAIPALTAQARGAAALTNGPTETLPAYVATAGGTGTGTGTIVLTPLPGGEWDAAVVWGGSETLGAHSTVSETRTVVTTETETLAQVAAALVSETTPDAVLRAAGAGIGYILLAPAPDEPTAQALEREADAALDQRDDLDAVGQTPSGQLWRVTAEVSARPVATDAAWGAGIAAAQLAVIAIAVLLAVPTSRSRAAARAQSRMVGLTPRERTEARMGMVAGPRAEGAVLGEVGDAASGAAS